MQATPVKVLNEFHRLVDAVSCCDIHPRFTLEHSEMFVDTEEMVAAMENTI